ncbi:NAD-P-binding protein [Stereum hirsutum FP-91666 SS1]|uniref:NAD-P-binding protein n=1 Tax=Stereum hirsutum (strain FP-91666) TaxID=721885 RepID=R7RY58_STEHR|nr:NAD-P-binding protein [Stereum hirsutum FP-91666 SS1]EIM79830.1 NAD-P-binding protein [Stereum hirsutum FP-91666 SS1]
MNRARNGFVLSYPTPSGSSPSHQRLLLATMGCLHILHSPSHLGTPITNAFLLKKASGKAKDVVILTRSSSNNLKTNQLAAKGATIISVNYNAPSALSQALSNVDVVISTLGLDGVSSDSQRALAEASKVEGVKLFVPSEYGGPTTDGPQQESMVHKVVLQERLKEIELPYTLIFNGPLMEICIRPIIGIDLANGKGIAGGDGTMPISWTAISDVASFLAHVLTSLPPSELEWRTFRIEGERASMSDIYQAYENKTGKKVEVTYRSTPELQEQAENQSLPARPCELLATFVGAGDGDTVVNIILSRRYWFSSALWINLIVGKVETLPHVAWCNSGPPPFLSTYEVFGTTDESQTWCGATQRKTPPEQPENHDVQIIQVGGDSLPFSVLDSDGRRDTSGGSGGSRSEDAHSWVLHRARDHVFHEQCGYAA